jgi:hypothetical protein
MSLIVSLVALLIVLGCSDPRQTRVPNDINQWGDELAGAVSKLSPEERELFLQYTMRSKLGEAFGGEGTPSGLTIGTAIEDQKEFVRKQAAQAAEETALKDKVAKEYKEQLAKLNSAVTVALVNKGFRASDAMNGIYQDVITIVLAFENKTDKDLSGFKGKAHFADMFGDTIQTVNLSYDKTIPARKAIRWSGEVKYNQFMSEDIKLRQVATDKIKFSFEPTVIIFSDGTRLPAEEPSSE